MRLSLQPALCAAAGALLASTTTPAFANQQISPDQGEASQAQLQQKLPADPWVAELVKRLLALSDEGADLGAQQEISGNLSRMGQPAVDAAAAALRDDTTTDIQRLRLYRVLNGAYASERLGFAAVTLPQELGAAMDRDLAPERLLDLRYTAANMCAVLAGYCKASLPKLLALLENADNEGARATVSAAVSASSESAEDQLVQALIATTNDLYASDLARALAWRASDGDDKFELPPEAIKRMVELLAKSDNAEARSALTDALGQVTPPPAALLEALASALRRAPDSNARVEAAYAYIKAGPPLDQALTELSQAMLSSQDPYIINHLAMLIGRKGEPGFVALEKALAAAGPGQVDTIRKNVEQLRGLYGAPRK